MPRSLLAPAKAADTLNVVLDQATIMKLPEKVATIVVGNPLIADVAVQSGGLVVVTGKGYGSTNIIALDRAGAVLMERSIVVSGAVGPTVQVYRGIAARNIQLHAELRAPHHARRLRRVFHRRRSASPACATTRRAARRRAHANR